METRAAALQARLKPRTGNTLPAQATPPCVVGPERADSMAEHEFDPATPAGITVLEQPDSEVARVRFAGTLRGRPVVWQARILTLRRHQRERGGTPVRAFIDVRAVEGESGELVVALPVERIDRPVLVKAATMVRQWKRLDLGRHEFGPTYDEPPPPA